MGMVKMGKKGLVNGIIGIWKKGREETLKGVKMGEMLIPNLKYYSNSKPPYQHYPYVYLFYMMLYF